MLIKLYAKYSNLLLFFTMLINWSSTCDICCYSIYLFCWYIIHKNCNFITFNHWSISNTFKIRTIFTNTCTRAPTIIFFVLMIIFTFLLICFIIPFLFRITCCSIEPAFTWNMLCCCFRFIFVYYHIKCFNINVFGFFWNTYFWRYDITNCSIFIYTNHEWITGFISIVVGLIMHGSSFKNRDFIFFSIIKYLSILKMSYF